jgi:hypothetical protein
VNNTGSHQFELVLTNRFQLSKKSAIIATTTLDGVEVSGGEIYIHKFRTGLL